jgi:Tfp pilus assembly protein PilO
MEWLSQACDIVILIAAVLAAIAGIYKFFINGGKGIKKKVDESNAEKEKELQDKIDARAQAIVKPMLEQQAATLTKSFGTLLDQHLPNRLVEHDKETRQKYLGDRLNYLN